MTILATSAIEAALHSGAIVCDPAPRVIEGAHIDVTLGEHWWLFSPTSFLDLEDADPAQCFSLRPWPSRFIGFVEIPPHGFILAHTAEAIGTAPGSGLIPCLHTRSTLARWGLSICTANAGFGDEGYSSKWTLEIVNPHPVAIALPVGARVGCITFERLEGSAAAYAVGTRYNVNKAAWQPSDMLPKRNNW